MQAAAVVIITFGACEGFVAIVRSLLLHEGRLGTRRQIWLQFGTWLLLGLEFELAADVVRTAISPNWIDIGQLGAISVIRTFLNYFLEKDLERYAAKAPALTEPRAMAAD